jgi:hypothetical protein
MYYALLHSLSGRLRENNLWKRPLVDQGWHLALEMMTSGTTHIGGERGKTPAKQQLGKT